MQVDNALGWPAIESDDEPTIVFDDDSETVSWDAFFEQVDEHA